MSRRVVMWASALAVATSVAAGSMGAAPAQAATHRAGVSATLTSAAVLHTAALTPPSYLPVLHQGARGKAVKYVQMVLGLPASGTYGPKSVAAVKSFQAKKGVKPANGVVGPATWKVLIAHAKAHPPVLADVPAVPAAWATTSDVWAKFDAGVEKFALCVARHESWRAGLWKARNPNTSASGAFQFLDSTWRIQSHRAGITGYARAYLAPPDAQALTFAVSVTKYNLWTAWRGTNCGHGT